MDRVDQHTVRRRIEDTYLFGPELKARLLERLGELEADRLFWLDRLIERAEDAHRKLGVASAGYERILDEIEAVALEASAREADEKAPNAC